ncbi:MAG TPA: acireductone synthase [bacterium]|nr:acireductone synthase [bacterium]
MIQAILTDIEGTTTDIRFVHDVLFPYAQRHLGAFIEKRRDDPEVREILQAVKRHIGQPAADEATALATLLKWMEEDSKITPLKLLQGILWREAYERGDFRGHVYRDAYEKLQAWRAQGLAIYIFSSGSVEAQKLLFRHSAFGDLTALFSGYFDTQIGAKREVEAYQKITARIGLPAAHILFLSDVKAELDAAQTAGLRTCWVLRSAPAPGLSEHPIVRSFGEIDLSLIS